MATSNAIGSNVFDILICLGLPWFLQTAVVSPGSVVRVISKGTTDTFAIVHVCGAMKYYSVKNAGLTYSTLSLLSTIVFLLGATHLNGWKLDRKYGVALLGWYLFFMIIASSTFKLGFILTNVYILINLPINFTLVYEMNIFGYFNPPECDSEF